MKAEWNDLRLLVSIKRLHKRDLGKRKMILIFHCNILRISLIMIHYDTIEGAFEMLNKIKWLMQIELLFSFKV